MKLIITTYSNSAKAWYDAMFTVIFRITEYGNYTNKAEVLASDNL